MAVEITSISADSIRRLVKRISDLEQQVARLTLDTGSRPPLEGIPPVSFGTCDGAVTARTAAATFGTGTANLTVYDTGTTNFRETALAQTVRNRHYAAFADDEIIRIVPDGSGDFWAEPLPYKPLVRFTLGGEMSETTASASATITDQYGIGVDADTSITVHNLEISGGTYGFDMASGAAGYALRDTSGVYRVIAHASEVTGKTRVSVDDNLDYLEDQQDGLVDRGEYTETEDLAMAAEAIETSDDEKVLHFINASEIPNHSATGKHALIIEDGVWRFFPIEECPEVTP